MKYFLKNGNSQTAIEQDGSDPLEAYELFRSTFKLITALQPLQYFKQEFIFIKPKKY